MKLLVLDLDGVINNDLDSEYHNVYHVSPNGNISEKLFFSKSCVNLINDITTRTGAVILLSSTWRLGETVESAQRMLSSMGLTGKVIGLTENLTYSKRIPDDVARVIPRGVEVHKWIVENETTLGYEGYFTKYVILDDDDDFLISMLPNFVQCDSNIGITRELADKAISILNVAM